jgi:fucose permease
MLPSVVYLASFIMSIVGAKLMAPLGLKKGLYIGFSFAILASIVIIVSKSFYILLVGYFISGLSVGMSSLMLNALLSMLPKEYQKFSLANACFGLGGILILPIDRLILKQNINFNYIYILHIVLIILFIIMATKIKGDTAIKSESKDTDSLTILKNPMILILSIAVFFYVGAEISTTNWTGTFLENFYGLSKAEVPNILLGFWILFTLGRAIGDKFLEKVGQLTFLAISPIISIVGIFIILSGTKKIQALIGLGIIGITMSLIYPALQGYIIQNVEKKHVPQTSAVITIFNNLGATFLTYVIGFAGEIRVTYVFIIQIIFYLYIMIVSANYMLFKPKEQLGQ